MLERLANPLCYTVSNIIKKLFKPNKNSINIQCNLGYLGFSSVLREIRTSHTFRNELSENGYRKGYNRFYLKIQSLTFELASLVFLLSFAL